MIKSRLLAVVLLFVCIAYAVTRQATHAVDAAEVQPTPVPHAGSIKFSRSTCYGTCVPFSIEMVSPQCVRYTDPGVTLYGRYSFSRIVARLEPLGFFTAPSQSPDVGAVDAQMIDVDINLDGRAKKLHYDLDAYAPKSVLSSEIILDSIVFHLLKNHNAVSASSASSHFSADAAKC